VAALYHIRAHANARQKIIRDDTDQPRLIDGLEHTVTHGAWELLRYVIQDNHLAPQPDLAAGMQGTLLGYAFWAGQRRQRVGQLFEEGVGP